MSGCSKDPSNWKKLKPLTKKQLKLFNDNIGLVNAVLIREIPKYYKKDRDKKPDLIQEGYLALAICTQLYKKEKDVKFSTYAYISIRSRMYRFLGRFSKSYIVPYRIPFGEIHNLPSEVSKDAVGITNLMGSTENYYVEMMLYERDLNNMLSEVELEILKNVAEGGNYLDREESISIYNKIVKSVKTKMIDISERV